MIDALASALDKPSRLPHGVQVAGAKELFEYIEAQQAAEQQTVEQAAADRAVHWVR